MASANIRPRVHRGGRVERLFEFFVDRFLQWFKIQKIFQTVYKHNFETNKSLAFYRKEQILKMSGIPGYRYIYTHEKPYLFNWLTTTETTYDIPERRYSLCQATTKLRQTITMGYGILLIGDGIAHGCHGRFTTATSRGIPLTLYAVLYNIPYKTVFSTKQNDK